MPRFRARFVRRNGLRGSLTIDAIDLAGLTEQIEGRGKAYLIDVRKLPHSQNAACQIKVPWSMLITALDSLELMLIGGARINTALRTIAECAPRKSSRRFWIEVVRSVEESGQFGESLRRFPKVFNDSMVGIIIAHEASGRLTEGIRYVRDYVAHMQEIRRESIRGLTYPAIVCAAGLLASTVI
jgi:type II secretory pathway component PulF